jgi:hypothetical protein
MDQKSHNFASHYEQLAPHKHLDPTYVHAETCCKNKDNCQFAIIDLQQFNQAGTQFWTTM